jgi:hypothetical protein
MGQFLFGSEPFEKVEKFAGQIESDIKDVVIKTESDIKDVVIKTESDIKDVVDKGQFFVHDTQRQLVRLADNQASNVLFTVRDTKSEFLHAIDSGLDNMAIVIDRQTSNIINTVQMGMLISAGTIVFFTILYGDKIFAHGVRLGKINLF